jgi:hypothetical protein
MLWDSNDTSFDQEALWATYLESNRRNWCPPPFSSFPVHIHPNFDPVMARILQQLRQISSIATYYPPNSPSPQRPIYTRHALILEIHINTSFWANKMNASWKVDLATTATSACFHNASFIYVNIALREIPIGVAVYDKMVSRVKGALGFLDLDQAGDASRWFGSFEPGFLLWVLVVAGAAAFGRVERGWFVKILVRLREILGLRRWEDARHMLMGWPWVENTFAELVQVFWDECERLQRVG